MRLVVIVPVGGQTGGVELLYQFVDAARRNGVDAHVCGYTFRKKLTIPEAYEKYNCPIIGIKDISTSDVIIVPEVYSHLWKWFNRNPVFMWWLSVDNYYNSKKLKYCYRNRFWPWDFRSIKNPQFDRLFSGHLCQSQYAFDHLAAAGIHESLIVSDYINRDFFAYPISADSAKRRDIVVYNPAKGASQTNKIIKRSSYEFHPIKNMTRAEVMKLLASAKVYIDFGNHPGKDRIPREAAALGCVVLTNKKGSAANKIDIEIDDDLKVDDGSDGFEVQASNKIKDIMLHFDSYSQSLASYREKILGEENEFEECVRSFINVCIKRFENVH